LAFGNEEAGRRREGSGRSKADLGPVFGPLVRGCAKPLLRPATIQAHESIIRNHIKPEIGDIRLSELKPLQLQALCSKKLKSGLSNRTVKYIKTILHQALEWGLVARNVTDAVKTPAPEKKPVVPLTKEQVWKLLDHLQDDRLFPLYVVYLGCGLRRGEALTLTWDCVDFDRVRFPLPRRSRC
jgi:integrase